MRTLQTWPLAVLMLAVGCGPNEVTTAFEVFPEPSIQAANDEDVGFEFDSAEQPLASAFGITGIVSPSRVTLTVISNEFMYRPTSLAFKPGEGSLWVVNRGDDSTVIIDNPGKSTQKVTRFFDDSAHLLNNPTQRHIQMRCELVRVIVFSA